MMCCCRPPAWTDESARMCTTASPDRIRTQGPAGDRPDTRMIIQMMSISSSKHKRHCRAAYLGVARNGLVIEVECGKTRSVGTSWQNGDPKRHALLSNDGTPLILQVPQETCHRSLRVAVEVELWVAPRGLDALCGELVKRLAMETKHAVWPWRHWLVVSRGHGGGCWQ